jgi:dihydrofolate reductase
MRKLILSMNTSIDGIVTDELSWMKPDTSQTWNNWFEMLKEVDLLLLGGGMWPDYRNHWDRVLVEDGFNENEVRYAQYAKSTQHVIFSKSLDIAGRENANIEAGDLEKFLRDKKAETSKDIQVVGGAKFAASVINTGLVDEYRIMVNPVIVGKGISLYEGLHSSHALKCTKVELMDNGVIIQTFVPI